MKEALTVKEAQGIKLGKRKGTIQANRFDKDCKRIEELLRLGLSVRKIAVIMGYSNHVGLNAYIKKRGIRESLGKG